MGKNPALDQMIIGLYELDQQQKADKLQQTVGKMGAELDLLIATVDSMVKTFEPENIELLQICGVLQSIEDLKSFRNK